MRSVGRGGGFHDLSRSIPLPVPPRVYQSGSSVKLVLLGFLWRLCHIGKIIHLISSLSPLSGMGHGVENSKPLILVWSFWWAALIQEPNKSHLITTKGAPLTQTIPRELGTLCQEPSIRTKNSPSALITRNYKGFRSSVQALGGEANICIFYFTGWSHFESLGSWCAKGTDGKRVWENPSHTLLAFLVFQAVCQIRKEEWYLGLWRLPLLSPGYMTKMFFFFLLYHSYLLNWPSALGGVNIWGFYPEFICSCLPTAEMLYSN